MSKTATIMTVLASGILAIGLAINAAAGPSSTDTGSYTTRPAPDYSTPDYPTPDYSTPDYPTPDYSTPDYPGTWGSGSDTNPCAFPGDQLCPDTPLKIPP